MTTIKLAVPLKAGGFVEIPIDDAYPSRAENQERRRLGQPPRTFMPREWIERMREPWSQESYMRNTLELCRDLGIPPLTEAEIQELRRNPYVPEPIDDAP